MHQRWLRLRYRFHRPHQIERVIVGFRSPVPAKSMQGCSPRLYWSVSSIPCFSYRLYCIHETVMVQESECKRNGNVVLAGQWSDFPWREAMGCTLLLGLSFVVG